MTNASGEPVHFAFPFQRGTDGKVACDVQDTPDHVLSQVNVIVRYPQGYRIDNPDFGIPWPEFANAPVAVEPIRAAVQRQVPNAEITGREFANSLGPAFRNLELDLQS